MSQEFVAWLASNAPEGETALIVRQKPILKDGSLQFHKDGAIKCTWPAMLPDKWRPGQALYGNTASFILDRFKDGRVSASAANCEYVLCMVLDDIGTKSKTPPLEPTWKMETSPGCYQWGYVFEEQPTKGEYSAAIIAIAAAGYTDPGAINPVRNFRLPGSINLKPGKDNFESKLIEWHKDRAFDLDQICTALGVTPAEADTAQHRSAVVVDDGKDEVVKWLVEEKLVLEGVNAAGWMGVVCPNASEHTDGNPMGRYMPANRAYACMHSHCCDWNSERFLTWVADNEGPDVQPGLRGELVAAVMGPALAKIEGLRNLSQFSAATDAAKAIQEVELRELGRVQRSDWYQRFAYLLSDDAYFDLDARLEVSRSGFNALFRHVDCRSLFGKHPRVLPSVCYDENRQSLGAKVLHGVTYAAGEGVLVAKDGLVYGNLWVDARPTGAAGPVDIWLAHLADLFPAAFEREHLLDVMAFKVQNPAVKINHAVLIGGHPGCGKDTLLAPFLYAVCGRHEKNKALIDAKVLESQFTYGLESEVMVVNELRPDQFKDRRALENTLKPLIAAPPEYLMVNRKGQHPYMALNRVLLIAMSNFRDAIALPSNDRRWFCLWTDAPIMSKARSRLIWDWYLYGGGFDAIAAWLRSRDVSGFNPAETPPMTEAKQIMLEQARSSVEEYIIEEIAGSRGPFAKGAIASPFHKVLDVLQHGAGAMKVTQGALMHGLAEAGWVDKGLIHSRAHPTKKRMFCRPDMAGLSGADLRALVEDAPSVGLKMVK